MKRILLVFNDKNELGFISDNLDNNGYEIIGTSDLETASLIIRELPPELAVINTSSPVEDTILFLKELQKINARALLLSDPKNFSHFQSVCNPETDNIIIPLRPKLVLSVIRGIMNKEKLDWVPEADHS
jgi:DNA-binding response OmpR family regulator